MYYSLGKKREKVSLEVQLKPANQDQTKKFETLNNKTQPNEKTKNHNDPLKKRILFSIEGKWMKSTKNNHKDKYFLKFGVLKLR